MQVILPGYYSHFESLRPLRKVRQKLTASRSALRKIDGFEQLTCNLLYIGIPMLTLLPRLHAYRAYSICLTVLQTDMFPNHVFRIVCCT